MARSGGCTDLTELCVSVRVCARARALSCAQEVRVMLLSTKSPLSVIIYNLNLPIFCNLAETLTQDDYISIFFSLSLFGFNFW